MEVNRDPIDTTKTLSGNTKNFVHKVFDEIESDHSNLILWNESDDGKSFIIQDTNKFSLTTLPRLFKHSNYASFVRQLNKYGFHKIKQQSQSPTEKTGTRVTQNIFQNTFFQRGRRDLLHKVRRQENKGLRRNNTEIALNNKLNLLEHDENLSLLLEKILAVEKSMRTTIQDQEERIKYLEIEVNDLKSKKLNISENQQEMQSNYYQPLSPNIAIPPDEQQQQKKQEEEIATKKLSSGFHILLCEDDDICIQICEKFLKKLNCKTTVVNDGLSCIQQLKDNPARYDLILMDIIIPQLDGTTTTAVIRSMNADIPIIAMTGNVNEDDLLQYLQNGMTDVLAKPFNRRDLQDMLVRYLGHSNPKEGL
ncbi:hypothetical protein QEN19_002597 [Hanseniaspora menglaensis]